MIVLDTTVISEAMKPEPNAAVQSWLDDQVAETLYLSSVTVAELLFAISALPDGRRKQLLTAAFEGVIKLFDGRMLSFDSNSARHYADLAIRARKAGKGLPTPDGYIAAIAVSHGFTVATRNTSAFDAANVSVINPWNS